MINYDERNQVEIYQTIQYIFFVVDYSRCKFAAQNTHVIRIKLTHVTNFKNFNLTFISSILLVILTELR